MSLDLRKITQALLSASVIAFGLSNWSHIAKAADQPNVMIMGEDSDEDTIPRHSRVFNRVSDALRTRMMELGFKVYNETAATMDITNPGRVRRTDAELISVAQNVTGAPIDVISAFQIYAATQQNPYSDIKQIKIRIVARMIQVQTGRDLGNFEVSVGPKGLKPIPAKCDRDCILEHVGDEARPIANEVGTILARELDQLSPTAPTSASPLTTQAPLKPGPAQPSAPVNAAASCTGLSTAYTIVLDGFDPADIDNIEAILVAFQGYEHHRPIRTQTRHSEYWYETCSDRARLERNFRNVADQLPGQNRLALAGNKFEIEHVPGVGQR